MERVVTLPPARPNIEENLKQLRDSLQRMHQQVQAKRQAHAERYRSRHHYEQPANFSIDDYVFVPELMKSCTKTNYW